MNQDTKKTSTEPITIEEPVVKRANESVPTTRAELDAEWAEFYTRIDPEAFDDTKRELDRLVAAERSLEKGHRSLENLRDTLAKRENEIRALKQRLASYRSLVNNVFTRRGFLEYEHAAAKTLLTTTTKDVP